MEELQVIETTSGRQFKPWATKDDVQDPASVTAIASEIASGKQAIASAINAKGGSASATESFAELADDVVGINDSFITYGVEVTEKIHWLNFICSSGAPARLPLTAIDNDTVTEFSQPSAFQNCQALESVKMTALTTISGASTFQNCSSLQEVNIPSLITISGNYTFRNCSLLQNVTLSRLTTISGTYTFYICSALQNVTLSRLTTISNIGTFENCSALQNLIMGTLIAMAEPFINNKPNLRNITIGQYTNINLSFQNWTATNVIAEGQSGIDELNSNLQTNLIAKLYQGGGKILRLGATLYDVTTQETRDMVTAKGWTLQRG